MIRGRILPRILGASTRLLSSKPGSKGSPASPERGRKTPFDSLGYELIESHYAEPQAAQRAVIDGLGPTSFTISGVRVAGSVLIMPFFSTIWNVEDFQHITPGSFALVKLAVPRPDIIVLGTGAKLLPLPSGLKEFFRDIRVNVETMDTMNASHTFNVLNQEDRNVAAALLPVSYEDDRSKSGR